MGASEIEIRRAAERLTNCRSCAVMTGAGVSAESGVPTFRDAQTGLYANVDPMKLASVEGFREDPAMVWRWYMARFGRARVVEPNPGHFALARLAARIERFTLITQNVDDLHERAGCPDVLHLHGSIARYFCTDCGEDHTLTDDDRAAPEPPACAHCGGMIRPGVVWFGEALPRDIFGAAERACRTAEVMLVAGTSGVVFPAADLPFVARSAGAYLIDVNPERTLISDRADLFLEGPSGEVLPRVLGAMD